ncbi:tRNA-guanine family transglycosylase [Bradyrhizobium sp. AZCC 1678]
MSLPNHFELLATNGTARTGRLTTPHGVVQTPAFMPVGTAGAMKGLHWREVRDAGTDIVLGNTYHLMLRPGAERIAALGGLQAFHRLERADADGLRRLPGDVAVGPAQGEREGRDLPFAY